MTTRLEEIEARVNRDAAFDMPRLYMKVDRVELWRLAKEKDAPDIRYLLALARSLSEEVKALRDACEFYAIPETYFGIGIFPDRPCGEFIDDISDCEGEDMGMTRKPGNKAREALAKADAIAKEREKL
jgi:methionine synthase II (cobalamin-independent)